MEVLQGDITEIKVEAIVNAANSSLMGGGGVDGAIHASGGKAIVEECKKWVEKNGKLPTGEAMITTAGELPAEYIIHTVGPRWKGGTEAEDQLLANCYINSLHICERDGISSVAIPNISTGIYGYPKEEAAEVAIATVKNFLSSMERDFEVSFVCFDKENYEIYQRLLNV